MENDDRRLVSNLLPTTSNQQPTTSHEQLAASHERLAASHQLPATNDQSGQVLVMAAMGMVAVVGVLLFVLQVSQLLSGLNAVSDAAQYAAQVAARPSAVAVVDGVMWIDEATAVDTAQAQMATALQQLAMTDFAQSVNEMVVEILNPVDGRCETFTNDATCYHTPAVRVTVPVTLRLLGLTIDITRQGSATTSASPGNGAATTDLAPLEMPTPVAWPTVQVFP